MFRTPQSTPHASPAKHSPRQTSFDDLLFRFPDEKDTTNDLSFEPIANDSPFQPSPLASPCKHLSIETATSGLASRQSCPPMTPLGSPRQSCSRRQTTSRDLPSTHNISSCIRQPGSSTSTHKSTDDCSSCVKQNAENVIRGVELKLCNAVHSLVNQRFPESLETTKTTEQSLYCSPASHKMTQSFPENMYTAYFRQTPEIRLNGLPFDYETEERNEFLPHGNDLPDDLTAVASPRSPSPSTWPLCTCKESVVRCPLSPDTVDTPWAENTDDRKRGVRESERIINRDSSGHRSEFSNSVSFADSSHTEMLSKEQLQRFRHNSRLVLYFHSVGRSPTGDAPCWTNGRTDDGLGEFMNGYSDGDQNI